MYSIHTYIDTLLIIQLVEYHNGTLLSDNTVTVEIHNGT